MSRHCCSPQPGEPVYPGGEAFPDPDATYAQTLQRHSLKDLSVEEKFGRSTSFRAVVFEPEAYSRVVGEMLAETGNCTICTNTAFREVLVKDGRIDGLILDNGEEVRARFFVDSTADAKLCQAAGCELMRGQESRDAFGEPDAPEQASSKVNAVTLIYRITPRGHAAVDPLPPDVPAECWWQAGFPFSLNSGYANGDLNINMLPTMQGEEFLRRLAAGLPEDIAVVRGIMPYSVLNRPMTEGRWLARFWRWVDRLRLRHPRTLLGAIINLRNITVVAVSADRRYGPVQNRGIAQVILDSLLANGYEPGSGTDRKSTRLNSSHEWISRMPSSA